MDLSLAVEVYDVSGQEKRVGYPYGDWKRLRFSKGITEKEGAGVLLKPFSIAVELTMGSVQI